MCGGAEKVRGEGTIKMGNGRDEKRVEGARGWEIKMGDGRDEKKVKRDGR